MDEMASELLSRYLDDDLSAVDRAEFERRLEEDPDLRAEADAGRELRRAVSQIAGEMEPPAALDAVMKPMLRSAPARRRLVRPAFRWLGAAAAVVLGVTVTLEVARRNPQLPLDRPASPRVMNHDDEAIFELAPLPSAVPDEHRPMGATDRLLEEELQSPEAPEPAPLEIMGPLPSGQLPTDPDATAADVAADDTTQLRSAPEPHRKTAKAPQAAGVAAETAASRERKSGKGRSVAAHHVSLVVDGVHIWTGWSSCPQERSLTLRIRVRHGVIVEAGVPDADRAGRESCLPTALVGAAVEGLSGGEHLAEIVVSGQ